MTSSEYPELVLFDLDGTLLDSVRDIRPASLTLITELRTRGIRVGVATGRTPVSAAPYVARISPTGPHVFFNGAMVWDHDQRRPVSVTGLARADAIAALEVANAAGVHVNAYVGEEVWIARESPTSRRSSAKDGLPHRVVGDVAALVRERRADVVKLMLIDEREPVMRLEAPLRTAIPGHCTLVNSEPEYLEVLAPGIDKGSALADIERLYAIPAARIIAFGDRHNDLAMLRRAGLGVAMGSGHPDVQAAADVVIGDNDSDAIAEFLRARLNL